MVSLVDETRLADFYGRSKRLTLLHHASSVVCDLEAIIEAVSLAFSGPGSLNASFTFGTPRCIRYDLAAQLRTSPRCPGEPICTWVSRVVGCDRFSIELPYAPHANTSFDLRFTKDVAFRTASSLCFPIGGLEFFAFLGNYGYTQRGIHRDAEHTAFLHLGPGQKVIHVWPPDRPPDPAGMHECQDRFLWNLRRSDVFVLSPGDGLSIPLGYYHIANNETYSMTLGVNCYPISYVECVNEYNRLFASGDSTIWSEAELLAANASAELHAASWVKTVETIKKIRESNAWVVRPPSLAEVTTAELEDSVVRCVSGTKVLLLSNSCEITMAAVRGRAVPFRTFDSFAMLCELLNNGQAIAVSRWKGVGSGAASSALETMLRLGGITATQ